MDDLIRRSDVVAICCDLFCGSSCKPDERDTCVLVEAVQANIPAVDAVELRHGTWMRVDYEMVGHDYICSECGEKNDRASRWCPDCGARMDGEDGDT